MQVIENQPDSTGGGEEPMDTGDVDDNSDDEGTTIEGVYIPPPARAITLLQNKNRAIITKITVEGFKSYGKKQILGPFHKCFNSIVGPNGSGKSNVIDAILFVFGYKAQRMRSKCVSVLIHSSKQFPNIQSCKVSVHFCEIVDTPDSDEYEVIPNSEFIVSRIGRKDNSSNYELDGFRVPFKEVAKLLRKHEIDLDHNRFLILQGEVEEISMMKCKGANENETGMLEYLEDIIGTARYRQPIEDLHAKMEDLTEEKLQRYNRFKILETEIDSIREPMKEAVEYLKTENKIVTCKNLIYQLKISGLEEEFLTHKEEFTKVNAEYDELKSKLETLSIEKAAKDAASQEQTEVYENLKKRQAKLKQAFDNVDKKDIQLQADMTQLNNNRKKHKEQLAAEKKKLVKLTEELTNNASNIKECEEKERKSTVLKDELEKKRREILAKSGDSTRDLQIEKEKLATLLNPLKESVNNTKKTLNTAEKELDLYVSHEGKEREKYKQFQTTFENTQQEIKEKNQTLSDLKKKLPTIEKSLRDKIEELHIMRSKEQSMVGDLTKKRVSFEQTKSNMQASKSRGRVLDALMQQKREGKCPGLYGRLGDLGAIDKKYDVAISTACGPLDNIVVDTVDTAQFCIGYLKRHDIGRATFIALEKQEHLRNYANSNINTPENAPRLFDLIKIQDENVKTAFYYALRDTLVANDLDQATRIAYGARRYRVVTLKGDLIETSGTMSGGGNTVSRGRMGQSLQQTESNPKELQSLELDLDKLEIALASLREKQARYEGEINELQPNLNRMKMDYERCTVDLKFLQQQQPDLVKQLREQEQIAKSAKADQAQVRKLQESVDRKKIDYDEASSKANEIQRKVDALTAEITEKTSGKTKEIDKNLNEIIKTIDKCKNEVTRLRVAIKTGDKNIVTCTKKIYTLAKDIESAEDRLREMKSQREEMESDAKTLLEHIEQIVKELKTKEDDYASIKEEVKRLANDENKLKSEKIDLNQLVKAADKKMNNCKAAIDQWLAKITHLKLQPIPDEELEELKKFSKEELESYDLDDLERELGATIQAVKNCKPNLGIVDEYKRKNEIYVRRYQEFNEIAEKREKVRIGLDKVKTQRREDFMLGFSLIKLKLKEMYQMLSLEGDADLELVDSFDPFTEGIQLNIRPPKKTWKKITQLSGGEKTLSSLALVFALHYYKPSPLYIMDEIDAALDFKNVSIVGNYIKSRTKNAQFIIISLRSEMCELTDNFIGIYKPDNFTLTISLNPKMY